jgi:hypothetical protein
MTNGAASHIHTFPGRGSFDTIPGIASLEKKLFE